MLCPSFETLALYASGQLSKEVQDEIAGHLSQPCYACQERLEWYEEAAAALRTPLDKGPDRLVEQARQLFEQSAYAAPHLPGIIFATLVFDSLRLDDRAGARSAHEPTDAGRRLLYHADLSSIGAPKPLPERARLEHSFDIDIAIKRSIDSNGHTVRGQILSEQEIEGLVYPLCVDLYRDGQLIQSIPTNKFGEFTFSQIVEGYYNLQIKSDKWVAVVNLPVTLTRRN